MLGINNRVSFKGYADFYKKKTKDGTESIIPMENGAMLKIEKTWENGIPRASIYELNTKNPNYDKWTPIDPKSKTVQYAEVYARRAFWNSLSARYISKNPDNEEVIRYEIPMGSKGNWRAYVDVDRAEAKMQKISGSGDWLPATPQQIFSIAEGLAKNIEKVPSELCKKINENDFSARFVKYDPNNPDSVRYEIPTEDGPWIGLINIKTGRARIKDPNNPDNKLQPAKPEDVISTAENLAKKDSLEGIKTIFE